MEKYFSIAVLFVFLTIAGLMFYDLSFTKEITVTVGIKNNADPFTSIPNIVANSGKIISVKQTNKNTNTYEVTIVTRKSRSSFLDWIQKQSDVEYVTLNEEL